VLLIAVLFALVAGLLFLVAWQWPRIVALFPQEEGTDMTQEQITREERLRVLRELEQSRSAQSEANEMTEAQKEAALESIAEPDESGYTEEQKLEILNSLNTN
jgi:hypothetical protein